MEKLSIKTRNGTPTQCGVDVFNKPAGPTVILTELGENPGPSITNAFEDLATALVMEVWPGKLGDPELIRWVECYDQHSYAHVSKPEPERFSLVTMAWDGRRYSGARFFHLDADEV
jgi:hypothetical protein